MIRYDCTYYFVTLPLFFCQSYLLKEGKPLTLICRDSGLTTYCERAIAVEVVLSQVTLIYN